MVLEWSRFLYRL